MLNQGRFNLLGVRISAVDYSYTVAQVIQAARERRALSVTALAVHGVMTGTLDRLQRYRLNTLDLVVPDGQPVRWALNWLYDTRLSDRVYGPTLMLLICEQAAQNNLPVYLLGSRAAVLESLIPNLQARFPTLQIAGSQASRFRALKPAERAALVQDLQDSGSAIVFIGLGCPRQEIWLYEHRDLLNIPMIAVGAAFDFHAGTMRQAPPLLQKYGLEWMFRLVQEPRRLWKRYLLLNPVFLALFFLQMMNLRQISPEDACQPGHDLFVG